MLFNIIGILLVLWLLGVSMNVGGLLHVLLVIAIIVFLVNVIIRRRARI